VVSPTTSRLIAMTAPNLPQLALNAASSVGRYFSAITVLPSAVVTMYAYLLLASGAWSRRPDWSAAIKQATDITFGQAAFLAIVTLAVAVASHPLQFGLIQFLEGYWGASAAGRALRAWRTGVYTRRYHHLDHELKVRMRLLERTDTDPQARLVAAVDEAEFDSEKQRMPAEVDRLMPTRLGNVLRRYEDSAGRQFGLDAVALAPHIALVAPAAHTEYLDDCRANLDAAVRVCILFLAASGLSFVVLVRDGLWLLVAGAPYLLGYLAYRGAVVAAADYGAALSVLITLNRFRLYEALHLPMPPDNRVESARNDVLMDVLSGETSHIVYEHPPVTPPT
jgi:hypothetical protein